MTGAETRLLKVAQRQRNHPVSLDDALARLSDRQAVLLVNERSGKAAVQVPATSVMLDDGEIERRVRLIRPMDQHTVPLTTMAESHWDETDCERFASTWLAELAEVPEFTESTIHVVAGLLLPIWKRLPSESTRVYRLQTDAGERIIGRKVSAAWVASVLATDAPALTPGAAFAARMEGRTVLDLAEGLQLRRVRVMGAYRIESFIEPELREGRGEIDRALKGELPKLVVDQDLRGIRHCHTDASDGTETLETMAKATLKRGFEYFGVADHSKSAHYAGGLSLEQIKEQHREAGRLNKTFGKDFRILKGIESDILADGSLDYPDDVLESFDFMVASIHGRFKLDRKAQTERLLRAIANPSTTILGHMTGRQLQRRPGYEIDVEKVLRVCAKHDVAVEINAHPWRLDLDWRWHQAALEFGCMMSINPDAHSIAELDHMHWGVEMARKGGVPADRVLNAMPLAEIARYLRRRRRSFARAA
ncbi:PHP domain-containing protein [Bradyrhizobium liaoningense]|uniref:PHP domain-containing protein n=1 Tax=Bradyrhizobium liaoningense TaxID=43992 RepID=UPI002012CB32|nr:PHP domain-containing protein [Bradyrhizobium liaoningense]